MDPTIPEQPIAAPDSTSVPPRSKRLRIPVLDLGDCYQLPGDIVDGLVFDPGPPETWGFPPDGGDEDTAAGWGSSPAGGAAGTAPAPGLDVAAASGPGAPPEPPVLDAATVGAVVLCVAPAAVALAGVLAMLAAGVAWAVTP